MRRTTIFAAAFFLMAAGAAWACPGQGKGHHGKGHHGKGHHGKRMHGGGPLLNAPAGHLQGRLDLDDEQVVKITEIKKALREATSVDREAMRELHVEMRALWAGADVPERSAVVELQSKMREHRDHLGDLVLTARIDATNVLNASQRKALAAKSAKRGHGHACGAECKWGHGGGKKGKGYKCPHSKKGGE